MNFFCNTPAEADAKREAGWKQRLAAYYKEFGVDPAAPANAANRAPSDAAMCGLVEELKPEVVSFHSGLPAPVLFGAGQGGRLRREGVRAPRARADLARGKGRRRPRRAPSASPRA